MNVAPGPKCIDVLLVEEDPHAAWLTREALRDGKVCNELWVVDDGPKAMAFLRRDGPYADAPRPDLILLNLEIRGKDGCEVLREVKADPALGGIPVVVVSAAAGDRAVPVAADAWVTKPVGLPELVTVVQAVRDFALAIVRRPAAGR